MPLIHKVLIANRGEIAIRVMRTCREMGIATVAVYSDADQNALHVQMADEAVHIGPSEAAKSYLNVEALLAAAKQTQADAVHPGYGFLAENAAFAKSCAEAGLIFIGPSPEAIDAMGSKTEAKKLMRKHEVPVVPGYEGEDQSAERLLQEAKTIGFPVLLKAAAGGGGKGMRIVREETEFTNALEGAKREAQASFGNDLLLIEKYFDTVRHIEFQVFGDTHGNIIHLNERECSVQRRYQKIIEESPSPALSDAIRVEMGEAAIQAAQAIHYTNAGTVEFIFTPDQQFYFLEVNTRLQVEHPVTEEVTGLDLVRLQIEIAEGKALPKYLLDADCQTKGHAIECRIYAEDPYNDFLPCTGKILEWKQPNIQGVRFDTGIQTHSEISIFYDPMVAKVIVHGENRMESIRKMRRTLEELSLLGLVSNQAFLISVLKHPNFQNGDFSTHFIPNHQAELLQKPKLAYEKALLAASLFRWANRKTKQKALPHLPTAWRNNFYQYAYESYQIGEETHKVEYRELAPNQLEMRLADKSFDVRLIELDDELICVINGHRMRYVIAETEANIWVHAVGELAVELQKVPRFPLAQQEEAEGAYKAPMPSEVVRLLVNVGDEIQEGDSLIVLSSMKMENTIYAHTAGKVEAILVEEKAFVEADSLLLQIT